MSVVCHISFTHSPFHALQLPGPRKCVKFVSSSSVALSCFPYVAVCPDDDDGGDADGCHIFLSVPQSGLQTTSRV